MFRVWPPNDPASIVDLVQQSSNNGKVWFTTPLPRQQQENKLNTLSCSKRIYIETQIHTICLSNNNKQSNAQSVKAPIKSAFASGQQQYTTNAPCRRMQLQVLSAYS